MTPISSFGTSAILFSSTFSRRGFAPFSIADFRHVFTMLFNVGLIIEKLAVQKLFGKWSA
jgi:hypothetical protein